jgi:opacity protein-like surface antigen
MKNLSARFPFALSAVFLWMITFPGTAHAQDRNPKDKFGGIHFGLSAGSVSDVHNIGPFTANITQTTGITITSLGVVTVPGITRDIPATRTGGPLDTTFPTYTITGSPARTTCTGNSDLGTFHTVDSAMITNKGERRHAFSAGLQIGYDHQFHKVVLGGEFEYNPVSADGITTAFQTLPATALTHCVVGDNGLNINGPFNSCIPTVTQYERLPSTDSTYSLMARGGWVWHKTLFYGVGGPALARMRVGAKDEFYSLLSNGASCPCPPETGSAQIDSGIHGVVAFGDSSVSHVETGWTAGAGIDRLIHRHWMLGLEDRHLAVDNKVFPGTSSDFFVTNSPTGQSFDGGGIVTSPEKVSYISNRISVRFNFRF